MVGHRKRGWLLRSLVLMVFVGVGVVGGLVAPLPAKAAPIGQPCDLFAGCVPPRPLADTYCCANLWPVYKTGRVGKKTVQVQRGWHGSGCRVISSVSNCSGGEWRIACNGWQVEHLSSDGSLVCSSGGQP
jgi:hypothetical protein